MMLAGASYQDSFLSYTNAPPDCASSNCVLVACVFPVSAAATATQPWPTLGTTPAGQPSAVQPQVLQPQPQQAPILLQAQSQQQAQLLLHVQGQQQAAALGAPCGGQLHATASLQPVQAKLAEHLPSQPPPDDARQQLAGRVWLLSRESDGCRVVQATLATATSDATREALALELRGHVWQAMRHRHANHVLQKCITTLRPNAIQFIIDELLAKGPAGTVRVARHAFGCRILQRLFEHCRPTQLSCVADHLLMDVLALSKHVFGNFVLQHLLEYGSDSQQQRLMAELEKNAPELGRDIHSGAVLTKALSSGTQKDQVALAHAIVRDQGALAAMARTRHGSAAAKRLLETVQGGAREEAWRQLAEEAAELRARRYGRSLVAGLRPRPRAAGAPSRGGA
mmetsp:Transcript_79575/g.233974  ORF Transcript_79575/g.233974 Transcript_79575/m.233974 type:complete len:397 (+) Transcript_79575:62-1252(+)